MLCRALLLSCLAALMCLPGWLRPDWDGTEGRRVQIALEMLRSGDWLVPTLGGTPTWAKPPLHYWLLAATAQVLGPGYAALRLPSVVAVFALAFCAGELLRRRCGRAAGWTAALGIVCAPLVLFTWPSAEIDPLFATATALSLWCLAIGIADDRRGPVLWSGLLAGAAFLMKGPPYLLFAAGAYALWWRHRRLRHALLHFGPLFGLALAYYLPLWMWRIAPAELLAVAGDESVGRIAMFEWRHLRETPFFWLRAVLVPAPFVFWLWPARGAGHGGDPLAADLALRMCVAAALVAVVGLTFFPGRPTRYLLPCCPLIVFALAPRIARYWADSSPIGGPARLLARGLGCGGALALMALPFVPGVPVTALGLAVVVAAALLLVRELRHLVAVCLVIPPVAAWTVGFETDRLILDSPRARAPIGALLRRELELFGATEDVATVGHFDSAVLLATGLWLPGNETAAQPPAQRWLLREINPGAIELPDHELRMELRSGHKSYRLYERRAPGR